MSALSIGVAANDEVVLGQNLLASHLAQGQSDRVIVEWGAASAGCAYNRVLDQARTDIVVLAHQDVYLPAKWSQCLQDAIATLAEAGQCWGVLGVVGVEPNGRIGGRSWSSGLRREIGTVRAPPTPVVSLDEMILVVRRSSGLRFDSALPGFHLYGTDIVQQALTKRCGAYVIDAPAIHNSVRVRCLGREYRRAYFYLRKKWWDRLPLQGCIIPITRIGWPMYRHYISVARQRLKEKPQVQDRAADPASLAHRLGYE